MASPTVRFVLEDHRALSCQMQGGRLTMSQRGLESEHGAGSAQSRWGLTRVLTHGVVITLKGQKPSYCSLLT